jgi:hypothetical protein
MEELEEKVDGEKMKEKGCPTLATGGTCELIGNDTDGLAAENPARSKAMTQKTAGDAMAVTVKALC